MVLGSQISVDTIFTDTYNCVIQARCLLMKPAYITSGGIPMADALVSNAGDTAQHTSCDQCGRPAGKGRSYAFKKPVPEGALDQGTATKCTWCAIKHQPMLRRSLIVAFVVGTILTLLNQGDVLFSGSWNSALYWKVPLTYCVPFCVATYGALSNSRR
jgi:hypothetical protein